MTPNQQLLIKNILQAPIQDHPRQEITYAGTLRFTYAQFRERVARLAAMLQAQGVEPGDTVAVMQNVLGLRDPVSPPCLCHSSHQQPQTS